MTKGELLKILHQKYPGIPYKKLRAILTDYEENIRCTLLGDKSYNIKSVLSLRPVRRAARRGIHPRTREPINIPSWKTVKLVISKKLRASLNGKDKP